MNYEEFMPDDLDVQKAVVESLAADKAEQEEKLTSLTREVSSLKSENGELKAKIESLKNELNRAAEILLKNIERTETTQVALLERSAEIGDRFEGETRDQVLEVLRESRDRSEQEGRTRRAQVLESVLVANEPHGELAKRRKSLEKLFEQNQNIINGQVINELDKLDISYKIGEKYLLPSEIVKREF